jgi:hypothetical protein
LNDLSPEATERLFIYYVCMGWVHRPTGQPEYLRRKMETVAKRIALTS